MARSIGTPLQCGELVPTNDEMRLCRMFLIWMICFELQNLRYQDILKMHVVPPSGKPLKFDFDGYVLNRVAHDEFLVDLARNRVQNIL